MHVCEETTQGQEENHVKQSLGSREHQLEDMEGSGVNRMAKLAPH